jgi:hypothetical protein
MAILSGLARVATLAEKFNWFQMKVDPKAPTQPGQFQTLGTMLGRKSPEYQPRL